jgi:GH25 family lysozyme M1 (1,4-beta-N-acetylmuramidase)
MLLRGFDTSHWQGTVDWPALIRQYELSFGACKATEGTTFRDSQFPHSWAGLADAGLVRMAYHYAHPSQDPELSADVFTNYVGDLIDTDLLVLDLETGDQLSQAIVNQWARAWAARIRQTTGRRPVLYAGHAYMENDTGVGLNGPFGAWWYPRYPSSYANSATWPVTFNPILPVPNAWGGPPDWWQFSQSFTTAAGPFDADVYAGTLEQLKGLNMAEPTQTYKEVWREDVMKPPAGHETTDNPAWWAENVLRWAASQAEKAREAAESAASAVELDNVANRLIALQASVDAIAADVKDLRALLPGE